MSEKQTAKMRWSNYFFAYRNKRYESGMTLVELMVSVSIFGIISLGIASVFTEHARTIIKSNDQSELAVNMQEFSDILESYLVGLTRFESCACSDGGTGCTFSETGADCNNGACATSTSPLIVFEYEDALIPSLEASGDGCRSGISSNPAPNTNGKMILKGCKKIMALHYTQPTLTGDPGKLTLMEVDPDSFGEDNTPTRIVSQLVGVTSVRCGQVPLPGGGGATTADHFRVSINMKAGAKGRDSVAAYPPSGGGIIVSQRIGSFHPTRPDFVLGLHRSLTLDVAFRNLTTPGIVFGRPYTIQDCTPDGEISEDGNCCSGYREGPDTALCVATTACQTSGNLVTEYGECCTHTEEGGSCRF